MQLLAKGFQKQPISKTIRVKCSRMFFPVLFSLWAYTLPLLSSCHLHILLKWENVSSPKSLSVQNIRILQRLGLQDESSYTPKSSLLSNPQIVRVHVQSVGTRPLTAKPETALENPLFRNGFAIKLKIQVKKRRKSGTSSLSTHSCPQLPAWVLPDKHQFAAMGTMSVRLVKQARSAPVPYVACCYTVTTARGKQVLLNSWGVQCMHQRHHCLHLFNLWAQKRIICWMILSALK